MKATVATLGLLYALGSHDAAALPSGLPESCTFIFPDGFRCCWSDGTCSDLYPNATPAPAVTAAPAATPVPTIAPSSTAAPSPTPANTKCPTSVSSTLPGIGVPGFSHILAGSGFFTTSNDTAALECGTTAFGKVIPCPPQQMGLITKNCVLTGFDPPPLLRAGVAANIQFPSDPIPFVALPTVGASVMAAGAAINSLSGSCLNPYKFNPVTGLMEKNDAPAIKSMVKCPVKAVTAGLATNSPTRPVPTPCPTGVPTCKDADAAPDPPGSAYPCGTPGATDGPVPNLPTGCTTTTVPGFPTPYSYCHKNLGAVIQSCPSGTCVDKIPGMRCGGAMPLLDPIPWDAASILPQCPPDDWCINPATSSLLRDGSIHLAVGTAPGVYNITIAMGQNNLYVGTTARLYTLPSMGMCKNYFPGAVGSLVLSEGYSYAILPASVIEVSTGLPCYGEGCGYSFYTTTTWVPADYDIDYATNPYRPYGAIYTPPPEPYPTLPVSTIPVINLATGTQVYFSLSAAGSITLPLGGSFVTPTGGLVTIPKNGWIAATGDGTTVRLGPGVGYLLDAGNMRVATGTCYVQLVPPMVGTQIVTCAGTAPPPATVTPTVPNVAVPILAGAVAIPANTPLPPFTSMEYDNTCPPPPKVTLQGALIEPSWCAPPTMFDPTTGTCVIPTVKCPTGVIPYTGPVPPPAGDGLKCNPVTACYDCSVCSGESCSWVVCGCAATGVPYVPAECDPPGFIWCHNTQSCTYGTLGTNIANLCGTIPVAPVPTPAPPPPPPPCYGEC